MQVRIDRDSWHYRLLDKAELTVPDNLCGYFWKVAFIVALLIGAALMAVLVAATLLSPILALFLDYPFLERMRYAGGMLDLIVLGFAWWVYRDHTKDLRKPSLVGQWVSAKKRHVCPLIEFV